MLHFPARTCLVFVSDLYLDPLMSYSNVKATSKSWLETNAGEMLGHSKHISVPSHPSNPVWENWENFHGHWKLSCLTACTDEGIVCWGLERSNINFNVGNKAVMSLWSIKSVQIIISVLRCTDAVVKKCMKFSLRLIVSGKTFSYKNTLFWTDPKIFSLATGIWIFLEWPF